MNDKLVNHEIEANFKTVFVVDDAGERLGTMPVEAALYKAYAANLDLVCMNTEINPPVCKIMDYGKWKFDTLKKEREMKKNQKKTEVQEIQLTLMVQRHDSKVYVASINN